MGLYSLIPYLDAISLSMLSDSSEKDQWQMNKTDK